MSTDGFLNFRNTKRATFVGPTSNISFDTENSSLGIGVTGPNPPSSNLYITGNAYVTSDFSLGGVLKMGTVNVVARHTLEAITATGNTSPFTMELTNTDTSLVASGNVEVGTANLFVNTTTGNVGIGTNVPDATLHVTGNAHVSSNLEVGTANLFVDTVTGMVGIGMNNPDATLEVQAPNMDGTASGTSQVISRFSSGHDGVLNIFAIQTGNGEETLGLQTQIDGRAFETDVSAGWDYAIASRYDLVLQPYKGNVGIGTSNPNEKLDVYGTGMRIHDTAASPKIDLLRGGSSRNPNTDTFGASDYVDWRITSGPQLKFQQQYTGANSGQLLDVMTLHHNSGNVEIPGYLKTGNPAFYARKTSGTSHDAYIIYNVADFNKGSCYNTSNGIFTCPVNGIYTFTWGTIGNTTATVYRLHIRINNSDVANIHLRADNSSSSGQYTTGDRTATFSLNSNDTVRIYYKADNGSSSLYGASYTHFQGYLISYT